MDAFSSEIMHVLQIQRLARHFSQHKSRIITISRILVFSDNFLSTYYHLQYYHTTFISRNMSTLPPYEKRQASLGLASKEDILKAAREHSDALFIDVRSKDEVAEAPFACCRFVHHSCTVDSTEGLEETVKPHVISYDAPVIVFCRSGRRAVKAKQTLEKMGCTRVLNAGGLEDMDYLSKENRSA